MRHSQITGKILTKSGLFFSILSQIKAVTYGESEIEGRWCWDLKRIQVNSADLTPKFFSHSHFCGMSIFKPCSVLSTTVLFALIPKLKVIP